MINSYSIGFALVAATVFGGVDYFDQTKKAGLDLGQLSVGAYAQTIPDRFTSAKNEKQAQLDERERQSQVRQGGRQYLPEAPEGWTRRALLEGDDTQIMPPKLTAWRTETGKDFLGQMQARDFRKGERETAGRSWIYQRGNETVFVEVRLVGGYNVDEDFATPRTKLDYRMDDVFERRVGYGIYGGMPLTERLSADGKQPYHFRYLQGEIGFGREVQLRVHANASREATEEILTRIDYDGLNSLLFQPMSHVGNDFKLPEGMEAAHVSMELRKLKRDFLKIYAVIEQLVKTNLYPDDFDVTPFADTINQWAELEGLKLKPKSLAELVQLGYYAAEDAFLAGEWSSFTETYTTNVVSAAVLQAQKLGLAELEQKLGVETPPEMSPELKKELAAMGIRAGEAKPTDYAAVPQTGTAAAAGQTNEISTPGTMEALTIVDELNSNRAAGVVVSKPAGAVEFEAYSNSYRAISEKQWAQRLNEMVAAFEQKQDMAENSCEFSLINGRIECGMSNGFAGADTSDAPGVLGTVVKGAGSALTKSSAGQKPKRLQMSRTKVGGQRCVGSFCD